MKVVVVVWALAAVGVWSYFIYNAGWSDGARKTEEATLRTQHDLEISHIVATNCDRALTSCQGWQARVGMGLDNVERACVTSDVIRERLKVLLERHNSERKGKASN